MSASGIAVVALSATPVKGLRITAREELELEPGGVRGDRRFYLLDADGRMVNGKRIGALNQVVGELEDDGGSLALRFPDGTCVSGAVELGDLVETSFFSEPRLARLVAGEFSAALSAHAGEPLRIVAPADGSSAIDRGAEGAVSMISRASLTVLQRAAGVASLDARRFRMSIEIDGSEPFAEDRWMEGELAVGEARIALRGHVGRCLVTSRHSETGEIDLPTLDRLRELRAGAATTEPLALGVYGEVRRAGRVRIGDRVALV